ncbi:histidine kinase [Algoriphagus aestuariicola]|uniref:histidine kinase n=1 Tax=Algoriphagus aestuariicola TaxID=1852016 RepID=A0ABS3BT20_9BACT|nr:ATP-binding protein [Algoriphagus aestuariicola]MBN7800819.1 histidine kinase [Algoriphagus aestuariicola]
MFLQFFIFSPKERNYIIFFVSVSALCYAAVFVIAEHYQSLSFSLPEGLLNAQKWNTVVGLPVLSMAIGAYAFFTIKKAEDETAKEKQDLKAAQAQLIQQEKLASLGQLTAGIAHEIKNPLNFVNNFSEVSLEMIGEIREERAKKTETRDEKLVDEILDDIHSNLEKIHEHGARANGIVTSMLHHSRGASGKKESTDLNALVKEFVNLSYHGMRAGKNPIQVEIVLDLADSAVEMRLVREDISRVIINLCNNAFDAMRERLQKSQDTNPTSPDFGHEAKEPNGSYAPVLRVATSSKHGKVAMAFEDNGVGIPDEIRDKIMQPFFTTKKGTEGTGLGLSITHDILKAHGGDLGIESKLGFGTVVQAVFDPSQQSL